MFIQTIYCRRCLCKFPPRHLLLLRNPSYTINLIQHRQHRHQEEQLIQLQVNDKSTEKKNPTRKMLSLKTSPFLHRPLSPLKSLFPAPSPSLAFRSPSPKKSFPSLSFSSSMDPTSATTTATATTTVEHVVLFKVRDATEPSKIDAMVSSLRALTSLNLATYLTAGPILRLRSAAASSLGFTHLLHSRYPSKPDLASYSAHPDHLSAVKSYVLPICDDIMAVDWIAAGGGGLPLPAPGSVMRLTLAKPKEGAKTAEVLAAIGGMKRPAKVEQMSFGENFSPARAKGYTVGFISVFESVEQMDAMMEEDKEMVEEQKVKVRPLVEDVIVVDYVVPKLAPASL